MLTSELPLQTSESAGLGLMLHKVPNINSYFSPHDTFIVCEVNVKDLQPKFMSSGVSNDAMLGVGEQHGATRAKRENTVETGQTSNLTHFLPRLNKVDH